MKLCEFVEDGTNVRCASWPLVQGRPLMKNNTAPLPPFATVSVSCLALPNISNICLLHLNHPPRTSWLGAMRDKSEAQARRFEFKRVHPRTNDKNARTKLILEPCLLLTHSNL